MEAGDYSTRGMEWNRAESAYQVTLDENATKIDKKEKGGHRKVNELEVSHLMKYDAHISFDGLKSSCLFAITLKEKMGISSDRAHPELLNLDDDKKNIQNTQRTN